MRSERRQTFGARLRRARLEAGLSQSALAEACGIPKTRLSRYENDHSLPSLVSLRKLAGALGVPEAVLLAEDADPEAVLLQCLRRDGLTPATVEEAERLAERLRRFAGRRRSTG